MTPTPNQKPVIVSSSVTFPSTTYPGVTFTIHRMTAGRRAELERRLLPYSGKVTKILAGVERANELDDIEDKSKSKGKKDDGILDISLIAPAAPLVDTDDTSTNPESSTVTEPTANTPNKTPQDSARHWNTVERRRGADNEVVALGISDLRPIYLEIYLKKVTGLARTLDEPVTDEKGNEVTYIPITTPHDVIEYAANDLVEEIFLCIYNSKEPGMNLSDLELYSLQLRSISAQSMGGTINQEVNSTANDVKS